MCKQSKGDRDVGASPLKGALGSPPAADKMLTSELTLNPDELKTQGEAVVLSFVYGLGRITDQPF